jgi:hypothetical protein
MRIPILILIGLFAISSVAPALGQEQPTFMKKPKVLGIKESTVTTFRASGDNQSIGASINCRGTCFSDGVTRYWQCKGTHADVMCHIRCSPPPPRGECRPL